MSITDLDADPGGPRTDPTDADPEHKPKVNILDLHFVINKVSDPDLIRSVDPDPDRQKSSPKNKNK